MSMGHCACSASAVAEMLSARSARLLLPTPRCRALAAGPGRDCLSPRSAGRAASRGCKRASLAATAYGRPRHQARPRCRLSPVLGVMLDQEAPRLRFQPGLGGFSKMSIFGITQRGRLYLSRPSPEPVSRLMLLIIY